MIAGDCESNLCSLAPADPAADACAVSPRSFLPCYPCRRPLPSLQIAPCSPADGPPSSSLQIAPSAGGFLHGSWNPPWTAGIIALVVIVAVLAGILLEGLMLSHRYESPHLCVYHYSQSGKTFTLIQCGMMGGMIFILSLLKHPFQGHGVEHAAH